MCPPVEHSVPNGVNGHTNGTTNGTANGSGCEVLQSGGKTSLTAVDAAHDGFTAIPSSQNPHIPSRNPYQPIGDFLSNISRFSGFSTTPPPLTNPSHPFYRIDREYIARRRTICNEFFRHREEDRDCKSVGRLWGRLRMLNRSENAGHQTHRMYRSN